MFAAMFTIQMKPGSTDSSDAVIIERDPVMFSYILRSLEGDDACLLELSEVGLSKLIVELDFYQLIALRAKVEHSLAAIQSMTREQVRVADHMANQVRKLSKENDRKTEWDAHRKKNLRIYKVSGCVVELENAAIGERVVRAAPGYGVEEDPIRRRERLRFEGTITSVDDDNGTEASVRWDDGTLQHNISCGKRRTYALLYA